MSNRRSQCVCLVLKWKNGSHYAADKHQILPVTAKISDGNTADASHSV
jgi:hypothetical protein